MTQMKWIDLFEFLNKQANDLNNLGKFPWQSEVEIFDFGTLEYYPAELSKFPDNKISLSVDTTPKSAESLNGV